jgi:hypothetical protein
VLDGERDELRAPQPDGEPEQQERAVAQPGVRCGVDAVDQLEQRVAQHRGLLVRGRSVDARDPFHDRQDAGV